MIRSTGLAALTICSRCRSS